MKHTLDEFVIQSKLGEGGYGVVVEALNSKTQEVVALKIIAQDGSNEINEFEMQKKVKSRRVLPIREIR